MQATRSTKIHRANYFKGATMGKILIIDIDKNPEAWVAQKYTKQVGSGDIAAICGADDYCTALKKWAVKTGKEPPDPENDHMWWGKIQEKPIAELAARRLALDLQYGNCLFAHDDLDWARATPDYFAHSKDWTTTAAAAGENWVELPYCEDQVIVECKNVSWRARRKWESDTPLAPRLQVMWQMGVLGHIKHALIAPLIGGDIIEGFLPRFVQFDAAIFSQMMEQAEKFKWHMDNDVPPPPTTGDAKLLDKIIGPLKEQTVQLGDECRPLVASALEYSEQRKTLEAEAKELKGKEEDCKLKLRQAMGSASRAECGFNEIEVIKRNVGAYEAKARTDTIIKIK